MRERVTCKWHLQVGFLEEVPHEMRFWEIADARNRMLFHTKSVPEPRWSTSAVRRLRDGLVCGRIMFGSWSDRFRIVNGVSTVFRACAVDRIPMWFATVGSFPQCNGIASVAGGWVADGLPVWFATVGSFRQCLEGFKCFGGRAEDVIPLCFARDCC